MHMEISVSGYSAVKNGLDGRLYRKAARRTLHEVGRGFKTKSVKEVRGEYNIKARDLKSKMRTLVEDDWEGGSFYFQMDVKGRTINLAKFEAMQTRKGVTVLIKRGGGRKLLKGAFIRRDSHGVDRVFMRKTKARLPITAKKTLSVPQMFNDKIIQKNLMRARADYPRKFAHNLDFYLGKLS